MHPVLADRKRLALYLLVWTLLAFLLALLTMEPGRVPFPAAMLLTLPPTIVYAFICLAAWYPSRAMPLHAARTASLLATHFFGALVLSGVWVLLFRLWARFLDFVRGGPSEVDIVSARAFVFVVTGALLYLLAVAFHYLLLALEHARSVEKREMEVKVLAREAELKALKAQLDPHFLFNSLNSISSLCGSNPSSARTLTTLLAEYLRKSLRFGSAESITLSEELELASSYLAIERIRFGPRLEIEQQIDESVRGYRLPPLLLQPLVENAVTHGIGNLIEGGVVQIAANRDDTHVRISVENRCDPDRPSSRRGEGIGLANTKRRVATFYGDGARVEVLNEPERFRVALALPL
jgi:two-component system, LytTR family, sensor histidine kinase AlgZ